MYHNVLHVFHVKRETARMKSLASRATIGVAASVTARPLIASGIGDNSAEIGDGTAGIVDIAANMIPC